MTTDKMLNCRMCSGNGIMFLITSYDEDGTERRIKAPCLSCSPDKRLDDLEMAEANKEYGYAQALEREQIKAHNERMKECTE